MYVNDRNQLPRCNNIGAAQTMRTANAICRIDSEWGMYQKGSRWMFCSLLKALSKSQGIFWNTARAIYVSQKITIQVFALRNTQASISFGSGWADASVLSITFKMSGLFPFPWGVHRSLWHAKGQGSIVMLIELDQVMHWVGLVSRLHVM